jgi:hypothetical protein
MIKQLILVTVVPFLTLCKSFGHRSIFGGLNGGHASNLYRATVVCVYPAACSCLTHVAATSATADLMLLPVACTACTAVAVAD